MHRLLVLLVLPVYQVSKEEMGLGWCRVCSLGAGWKDEDKWINAAKQLNFSREQKERIFDARKDMLAKLEK